MHTIKEILGIAGFLSLVSLCIVFFFKDFILKKVLHWLNGILFSIFLITIGAIAFIDYGIMGVVPIVLFFCFIIVVVLVVRRKE